MVRVHPRWLAARELVRKGKIGELRAFVGTFGYDLPPGARTSASRPTWAAAFCSTSASTRSP